MTIIDFHTHILPGIDDGSKDWKMTTQMLQKAEKCGIKLLIATPHFYADRMQLDEFMEKRKKIFPECFKLAKECGIVLLCGSEVAFFRGISKAENIDKLCISGTNLMLIEMPFREWEQSDLDELQSLRRRGITPVIAHLERFYGYQKDENLIKALFRMPVYIQLNASCFLNWKTKKRGFDLMTQNHVHFLGSDCHNTTTRPENIDEARKVIGKKFGEKTLNEFDRCSVEIINKHRIG